MKISSAQAAKLREALEGAYDDRDELERTVSNLPGKRLDLLAPSPNFPQAVYELVDKANREEWIEDLFSVIWKGKPRSTTLRNLYAHGVLRAAFPARQDVAQMVYVGLGLTLNAIVK